MTATVAIGVLGDGVLRLDAGQLAVAVESGAVAVIAAVVQTLFRRRLRSQTLVS